MPGGHNGDEVVKHVGKRRVRITGRFYPNGSSAIDNTANQSKKGWTVVRTSQGLYTVTLELHWLKLVPGALGLQLATAAARFLQWGAIDPAGKTAQIRCIDATGAVQDIAAGANNSIGFELEAVQDGVQG
jgi:hypothetical protein